MPADHHHPPAGVRSDFQADRPHQQPAEPALPPGAEHHHLRVSAVFAQHPGSQPFSQQWPRGRESHDRLGVLQAAVEGLLPVSLREIPGGRPAGWRGVPQRPGVADSEQGAAFPGLPGSPAQRLIAIG